MDAIKKALGRLWEWVETVHTVHWLLAYIVEGSMSASLVAGTLRYFHIHYDLIIIILGFFGPPALVILPFWAVRIRKREKAAELALTIEKANALALTIETVTRAKQKQKDKGELAAYLDKLRQQLERVLQTHPQDYDGVVKAREIKDRDFLRDQIHVFLVAKIGPKADTLFMKAQGIPVSDPDWHDAGSVNNSYRQGMINTLEAYIAALENIILTLDNPNVLG